jgi:hypothetical protein
VLSGWGTISLPDEPNRGQALRGCVAEVVGSACALQMTELEMAGSVKGETCIRHVKGRVADSSQADSTVSKHPANSAAARSDQLSDLMPLRATERARTNASGEGLRYNGAPIGLGSDA